MKQLIPIEHANRRVLTTAQAAEALHCSANLVRALYKDHKDEFQEGVHFFNLTGGESSN